MRSKHAAPLLPLTVDQENQWKYFEQKHRYMQHFARQFTSLKLIVATYMFVGSSMVRYNSSKVRYNSSKVTNIARWLFGDTPFDVQKRFATP